MATMCWFPSSGSAAVSPTPDATLWNGHVNTVSRVLNFTNGGTANVQLDYNPDAVDHTTDVNTMVAQFVSQILPAQAVSAQQILWGAPALEAHASNNLFPIMRLYCVNGAGTSNLGNILSGTRQATELGTASTGTCWVQAGSAVTLTENWRLVAEWGAGGLPVAGTGTNSHNMSITFGEVLTTGTNNLPQQGDTSPCPAVLMFSNDLIIRITPPLTAAGVLSVPVSRGW